METEDENKFDLHFRSILGEAAEDVPEGFWQGIEKRLADSGAGARRRKPVAVPLILRVSAALAAAAATAAVLFLSGTFDNAGDSRQERYLAGSGPGINVIRQTDGTSRMAMAEIPQARPLEDIRRAAGKTQDTREAGLEKENPADTGQEVQAMTGDASASGTAPSAPDTSAFADSHGFQSGTGTDELERLLMEDSGKGRGRKIRTSLTLSGNAISNTNASASRSSSAPISYRPGRNEAQNKVSESSPSSYSVPISFGVGVKVDFTERWAMGIGVNYSMLRRTFSGQYYQVQENGELSSGDFYSNILNRQDYIGIPLNVYFSILENNFIDFYAYAGGSAEKCVSNTFKMSADGSDIIHREAVEGFQFSVNAGIGMEFIIAHTLGIYIDPSLRYYFPDARQPRSIRTAQPLMFGLELGFRVRL